MVKGTPIWTIALWKPSGEKVNRVGKGKGGVRRRLVIVNPSIRFSKAVEDNLSFRDTRPLRHRKAARERTLGVSSVDPVSRERFLGSILSERDSEFGYTGRDKPPKEGEFAEAAAVAPAVTCWTWEML
jgi:dihydroneopterin aldolase/2-amino-4-hydroxy-6-hydroxymethyldihydropteridine diphosphokinase/dihydropteroate synthase